MITSYLRFCLAFHPYPQLIPDLFNGRGFGPPVGVTPPSAWPWIDQPVSGLRRATESPYSDSLSLRLRHPSLKLATQRKSLTHYTKGTPSLGLLQAPTVCMHAVSGSISLPSRGSFRLSLTVLVHYRSMMSI